MAKRRRIHRRPVEEVVEADEESPEEDADEVVEDEVEDDEEDEVEDDEEDEVDVPPRRVVKSATKVALPKKPALPVTSALPVKPAVKQRPVGDGKVSVKSVDTVVAENVFEQLLETMDETTAVVITRLGKNKWQLQTASAQKLGGRKMTSSEAWHETVSEEFLEWSREWNKLSFAEKKKRAKKMGLEWKEDDDPRVEVMRITAAVREKEGIEKYKPEYRERSARAALRR